MNLTNLKDLTYLELYPKYKIFAGTCMSRQNAEKCDRDKEDTVKPVLKVIPEKCTLAINVAQGTEQLKKIKDKDSRVKLLRYWN